MGMIGIGLLSNGTRERALGPSPEFLRNGGILSLGGLRNHGVHKLHISAGFRECGRRVVLWSRSVPGSARRRFRLRERDDAVGGAARDGRVRFQRRLGTQESLIIAPEMWRQIFKPRYRKQFERAHQLGLHVWFHSCGNIGAIVEDFHEIGVDVMNISQPNVVDLARVSARLRGRQCFMAPASYQTTSISGRPEEIEAEVRRVHGLLGTERGGFVGYVEEYGCVGMSEENYRACARAFSLLGRNTMEPK